MPSKTKMYFAERKMFFLNQRPTDNSLPWNIDIVSMGKMSSRSPEIMLCDPLPPTRCQLSKISLRHGGDCHQILALWLQHTRCTPPDLLGGPAQDSDELICATGRSMLG